MKTRVDAGDPAPAFQAPSTDGGDVSLESLRGKVVVLYFYPRDDTPGCTQEACDFRDSLGTLASAGAVVLGVSRDSLESHRRFRDRHGLTFPLLSDPEGRILDAYGAWKQKSLFGRTVLGIERSTFVIGRDGRIARAWRGVKVAGHAAEVLAVVRGL